MIFHHHKCIFTHIPKCAGTSIFEALGGEGFSNHYTLKEDASIYNLSKETSNNYFKFTFVRNPWDRFVSAYFYFKEYGRDGDKDIKMGNTVNRYKSFKDFVLNFNRIPTTDLVHPHFTEQINWVCGNHDFIGNSENLQQDFNIVCDEIGIPHRNLPYSNRSDHKHYTEYYDDDTRTIVAQIFSKDIQLFGHNFEGQ